MNLAKKSGEKLKTIMLFVLAFLISCDNSTSNEGEATKLKVLVLSFDANNLSQTSMFGDYMPNFTFTTFNSTSTIDLAMLDSNDVVIFFTNSTRNETNIGSVLYNYVMGGGKLILGTFYAQQARGLLDGANYVDLETITPLFHNGDAYINDTLTVKSSHPITRGVDKLFTYYGAGADSLQNNGKSLVKWDNGDVFAAMNEHGSGRILMVTLFPAERQYNTILTTSGQENLDNFYKIWANSIRYVYSKNSFKEDFEAKIIIEEGGKKFIDSTNISVLDQATRK